MKHLRLLICGPGLLMSMCPTAFAQDSEDDEVPKTLIARPAKHRMTLGLGSADIDTYGAARTTIGLGQYSQVQWERIQPRDDDEDDDDSFYFLVRAGYGSDNYKFETSRAQLFNVDLGVGMQAEDLDRGPLRIGLLLSYSNIDENQRSTAFEGQSQTALGVNFGFVFIEEDYFSLEGDFVFGGLMFPRFKYAGESYKSQSTLWYASSLTISLGSFGGFSPGVRWSNEESWSRLQSNDLAEQNFDRFEFLARYTL